MLQIYSEEITEFSEPCPFLFACLCQALDSAHPKKTWGSDSKSQGRSNTDERTPWRNGKLCLDAWQLNGIFPQLPRVHGTAESCPCWLFTVNTAQPMDTVGETAVGGIVLYTILLKEDLLRYTDGICLVLSAWWMSAADSQSSQAKSDV